MNQGGARRFDIGLKQVVSGGSKTQVTGHCFTKTGTTLKKHYHVFAHAREFDFRTGG